MNVAAHAFPDPSDEQRGMLVAGALWVMSVCKYSHAWARPRTFCGRELDILRRWPGAGLRVGRDLRRCIGASWTQAQAGFPVHRNELCSQALARALRDKLREHERTDEGVRRRTWATVSLYLLTDIFLTIVSQIPHVLCCVNSALAVSTGRYRTLD